MRKDTVCHVRPISTNISVLYLPTSDCTEKKIEFIIHFVRIYVCMRKQIDAAEMQAEPTLPF